MCARTPEVRDAIIAAVPGVDACEDVSAEHLAAITGEFSLREHGITALRAGDFEGLVGITRLNLSRNELTGLPVGVFDGLAGLPKLTLARNALASLPEDVFAGLAALRDLDLWQNQLTTLPVGIFAGLSNLQDLDIEENELVALPAGVFAGLDLRFLGLEGNSGRQGPLRLAGQSGQGEAARGGARNLPRRLGAGARPAHRRGTAPRRGRTGAPRGGPLRVSALVLDAGAFVAVDRGERAMIGTATGAAPAMAG